MPHTLTDPPQNLRELIGDRVAIARNVANLSTKELSDQCLIGHATILRIESGRQEPTAGQLRALSKVLHVTTDYLLAARPKIDDFWSEVAAIA